MALDISRWRNNPATEEHHDNKSNLAKKRTCICQGSSVGRAGKTLILPVLKNTASAIYKKKSYGIVNPRVVGSNPTLGPNASPPNDATLNTDFESFNYHRQKCVQCYCLEVLICGLAEKGI